MLVWTPGTVRLPWLGERGRRISVKSDDCKLADHEEGRGSLCPRSLTQLTDIPFFLSMDEETSDATIQSESPGPRAPADIRRVAGAPTTRRLASRSIELTSHAS